MVEKKKPAPGEKAKLKCILELTPWCLGQRVVVLGVTQTPLKKECPNTVNTK